MTTAVLVIDVQSVLFDPLPQPYQADTVISNINTVTSWARDNDYPVIFIQHEQADSMIEYESEGWQLQSGLAVASCDAVVRKTTPDSFLHTNLQPLLEDNQISHLIICGYATEFCVDTTSRRAAGLGYSVELVSDAHTTHDKDHASAALIRQHHNCTLPNISSFGVKISTTPTSEFTA